MSDNRLDLVQQIERDFAAVNAAHLTDQGLHDIARISEIGMSAAVFMLPIQ